MVLGLFKRTHDSVVLQLLLSQLLKLFIGFLERLHNLLICLFLIHLLLLHGSIFLFSITQLIL
jgi:hypothetical protein